MEKIRLAIDTGQNQASLALSVGGKTDVWHGDANTRAGETVLGAVHDLFRQNGVHAADLDEIVYSRGPGAFTGLRIGLGIAKGLAAPWATPLVAIPSLDVAAMLREHYEWLLAAFDARMGEVFYAWYDTRNFVRRTPYAVAAPEHIRLPEGLNHWQDAVGVGNAFSVYEMPCEGSAQMPDAVSLLAAAQSERYTASDPATADLLYVRDKIALTAQEQAQRRARGGL